MEHRLEINLIHEDQNFLKRGIPSEIVQTKPFNIGFSLKNIGETPIRGATIDEIRWNSASGKNMFARVDKSFHIDTLNPDDEKKIWVEKVGTYVDGLCAVNLRIKPDVEGDSIRTFQKDPFTGVLTPYEINRWENFFYVRSKNEYEQTRANSISAWLTGATVVLAILNFVYFFAFEVRPKIVESNKVDKTYERSCKEDLNQTVPMADGTELSCEKFLERRASRGILLNLGNKE